MTPAINWRLPLQGALLHAPRYEELIAIRHCMNPPREGGLTGEGVPSGVDPPGRRLPLGHTAEQGDPIDPFQPPLYGH